MTTNAKCSALTVTRSCGIGLPSGSAATEPLCDCTRSGRRKTFLHSTFALESAEEIPLPRNGFGQTDGPGTYKWYKTVGIERTLKFGQETQV